MCNCPDTFEEIEIWAREKEEWLQRYLTLPNGIPSHDTFARLFGLIDPQPFEDAFRRRRTRRRISSVKISTKTMVAWKSAAAISLMRWNACRPLSDGLIYRVSRWSSRYAR